MPSSHSTVGLILVASSAGTNFSLNGQKRESISV